MNQSVESKLRELGGLVPVFDRFVPVTEPELRHIEATAGAALPPDYRDFACQYGLSTFGQLVQFQLAQGEPVYSVPGLLAMPVPRHRSGLLSVFYGGSGDHGYSLARAISVYQGRMPDTIIPIGDEGSGNQICLGLKGSERGNVYYWDHHHEWDEDDYLIDHGTPMPAGVKFQNVYLIAGSFTEFILRLERCASA
jgi:hypothetical protein